MRCTEFWIRSFVIRNRHFSDLTPFDAHIHIERCECVYRTIGMLTSNEVRQHWHLNNVTIVAVCKRIGLVWLFFNKKVCNIDWDTSRMMLRMIVGPALRNQERMRWCLSHNCAPPELAVGFWWIRVPSGHGAEWWSTMVGCMTTALIGVLLWEAAWLRRDAIAS